MGNAESVPNAVRRSLRSHSPASPTQLSRTTCWRFSRQAACSLRKTSRSTGGGSGHGWCAQAQTIAEQNNDLANELKDMDASATKPAA